MSLSLPPRFLGASRAVGWLLVLAALGSNAATLRSLRAFFSQPLDCAAEEVFSEMQLRGYTALAASQRWEPPLEAALSQLEAQCSALTAVWSGRLAERAFHEAVSRERITASAASNLLADLLAARGARKKRRARGWWRSRAGRRLRGWQASFFGRPPSTRSAPSSARPGAEEEDKDNKEEADEADDEGESGAEAGDVADTEEDAGIGVLPGDLAEAERFLALPVAEGDASEEEAGADAQHLLARAFARAGLPPADFPPAHERLTFARAEPARAAYQPGADDGGGAAAGGSAGRARARTVEEALRDGGWQFERKRKHIIFKRTHAGTGRTQTFVQSATPSDWRAGRAQLSNLRRLEDEARTDPPAGRGAGAAKPGGRRKKGRK